jgi:hypothetical protein
MLHFHITDCNINKKTLTAKQKEMLMAGDVAVVEVVDELN